MCPGELLNCRCLPRSSIVHGAEYGWKLPGDPGGSVRRFPHPQRFYQPGIVKIKGTVYRFTGVDGLEMFKLLLGQRGSHLVGDIQAGQGANPVNAFSKPSGL